MYHKQGTDLVNVDKELVRKQGTKVIQRDFSKIVDGKIRHDSDAISLAIMQIVLSDIRYSLKDKNIKLNSLIFDKTIYENGPKIVVIGAGSRSRYTC